MDYFQYIIHIYEYIIHIYESFINILKDLQMESNDTINKYGGF